MYRYVCTVPFRPTTASNVPEKFVHIEAHGCSRLMTNFFDGTTEVSTYAYSVWNGRYDTLTDVHCFHACMHVQHTHYV